jgi:hypothetical protein
MKKIKVTIEATVSNEYREGSINILKNKIDSGDYSRYLLENGKKKGITEVNVVFEDIDL